MDTCEWNLEKIECKVPDITEVCRVLSNGLRKEFTDASVELVECPDLTLPPYSLTASGLCGRPCIIDVGGVKNIIPMIEHNKHYNVEGVAKLIGCENGMLIGAGAAPFVRTGCNAEWICNTRLGDSTCPSSQQNHLYSVNPNDATIDKLKCDSNDFDVLGNLYFCEGLPGKVLEVKASGRISSQADFTNILQKSLMDGFPGETIALGGVFVLEKGQAKCHVMPRHYSRTPLTTDAEMDDWLRYYNLPAPLTFLGVFVSNDPGFDLRQIHFHGYNPETAQGGHYHNDVGPPDVGYKAYFHLVETIYRVDRPAGSEKPAIDY